MSTKDEQSRAPNDAAGPNVDETSPDDALSGNQQRAYAARHPREVLRNAHEAVERATERFAHEPGEKQ